MAVGWVRGQLIHAATAAPLELRQFRPGAAPRWNRRASDRFSRPGIEPGKRGSERLSGREMIGLLGHLTEVSTRLKCIRELLRSGEAGLSE